MIPIASVLLASAVLASYTPPTGTKLLDSWRDPETKALSFKKILVVAVTRDPSMRKDAEERLIQMLGPDRAMASQTLFPGGEPPDKEVARAKIEAAGCDGVVVLRAVGTTSKTSNIPGRIGYDPVYGGFYGYWGMVYTTRWEAGYQEHDTTIKIETLVYDLGKDKLVWSGESETKNPGSVRNLVLGVAETVGKEMRKEKLIR